MTQADYIISKFGGIRPMARALGHKSPSTVQYWKKTGWISAPQQSVVLEVAARDGISLSHSDFFLESTKAAASPN